ncbi:MAG: class I SAM-dependent RNA methyltransferase [Chloroflexi bacterium]|nr:class I SAM-dependent RNA methyltransferase [Chloroflexota bacterium]
MSPTPTRTEADVELSGAAFGGEAVGHLPDGRVVFVPRGLPGELVRVQVVEERRDFARGELVTVLRGAAQRIDPPCAHYAEGCGGCSWQHADYSLQLQLKQAIVVDQLGRIGHFPYAEELVRPPLGMLEPWHYRNQARFTVGRRFGELCFTHRGSHRLLRIEQCWIVHPSIDAVLRVAQGRLADIQRHIHQISVRVGANTGELLISPALPEIPELESGQPHLEEELLGRRFRLQPPSFFQVNTRREQRDLPSVIQRAWLPLPANGLSMADLLALLVVDRLSPDPADVVVDAYSGVGTFALLLAPLVRETVGIEEARSAIRDAEHNARDVPNVRFVEAKTEAALPSLSVRPSAVVLDPARAGCHPEVLRALLATRPARIVYVSCDPSTLARDLRVLVDGGYTLHEVQPLDMFPQTYHVECVALLTA